MEQTAVEWLQSLHKKGILIAKSFEMAKEMEKEQIEEAFKHGELPKLFDNLSAELYYNETYNK
jgi:hypothetical protein